MEPFPKQSDQETLEKKTLIMKKFIKKYKSYSCMWNANDPAYHNNGKRIESQKKLLAILKRIDPYATLRSVKSQINSLRSNFRKHLRIYQNSELFDPDYKSIVNYETHNWRFHSLKFLCSDIPLVKDEETDEISGTSDDEDEDMEYLETEFEVKGDSNPLITPNIDFSSPEIEFSTIKTKRTKKSSRTVKNVRKSKAEEEIYYDENSNSSETISSNNKININEAIKTGGIDKELQAIGTNVAYKLQRMDPMQRCHAELLINKVLIYGLKYNLTEDTELTDFQRLAQDI